MDQVREGPLIVNKMEKDIALSKVVARETRPPTKTGPIPLHMEGPAVLSKGFSVEGTTRTPTIIVII